MSCKETPDLFSAIPSEGSLNIESNNKVNCPMATAKARTYVIAETYLFLVSTESTESADDQSSGNAAKRAVMSFEQVLAIAEGGEDEWDSDFALTHAYWKLP